MPDHKDKTIFGDRRAGRDRRRQNLPMPAGLDRRKGGRRNRAFSAQPWWLRISYAEELVREKDTGNDIQEESAKEKSRQYPPEKS